MTRLSQKEKQKQAEPSPNQPEKTSHAAGNEGVFGLTEILKEIRKFCLETAGKFDVVKKEIKESRADTGQLKLRMDADEEL